MALFGLITTAELDATKANNLRRQVFYQYPNGKFPLMGLLSLMDEGEQLGDQEFGWHEDRFILPKSLTVSADSTNGPFTDLSGGAGVVGVNLTTGGWSQGVNTSVRIKVQDATQYRQRDVVWIKDLPGTAGSKVQFNAIVDAVYPVPNTIDVHLIVAITNALNDNTTNNFGVDVIGSAAVEGGFSKLGGYNFPVAVKNYTQTERTVVGPFSRAALKKPQIFDATGVYQTAAKQAHIRHMIVLEFNAFFGVKGSNNVYDSDDGTVKVEKTSGGLLYFLRQWELGNVTNGGIADYRPGQGNITASDWNVEDQKRVISLGGASVTKNQFDRLIYMAFLRTGDTGFEKLVCCGAGFLMSFNRFAEANSIKVVDISSKENTYGMAMTVWHTVWGDLYFKVHPLFTENPRFNNSAFVLDMPMLQYHSLADSDSELYTMRQARDYDGRKDEWLTESGVEYRFPENHMFIDNLGGITV